MKIGYARVSKKDGSQSLYPQLEALEKAGCEEIYKDSGSGAKADLDGFIDLKKRVRSGDQVVAWKIDRLGRTIYGLLETLCDFYTRGVSILSISEGINTSTKDGLIRFMDSARSAEMERVYNSERTIAALNSKRRAGVRLGRKTKLKKGQILDMQHDYLNTKKSAQQICEKHGVSRSVLYRYITKSGRFTEHAERLFGLKNKD